MARDTRRILIRDLQRAQVTLARAFCRAYEAEPELLMVEDKISEAQDTLVEALTLARAALADNQKGGAG